MADILMDTNVNSAVPTALLARIQLATLHLAFASMGVKQDGLVADVISNVMLLTVRNVLMMTQIHARNAVMTFTGKRFPHASLVQTIAVWGQNVISAMVLVLKAARKIGQENSAIYHAHPTADSAISLICRPVHCANTTSTVTAVSIHAMQGVLLKTD